MTEKDVKTIKKYFIEYSDKDYCDTNKSDKCKWYYHKDENFYIIIFDDNSVYQSGTENNYIGIELKTLKDLKTRFKSFTGENYDNIKNYKI
jgi:hypothetical protein